MISIPENLLNHKIQIQQKDVLSQSIEYEISNWKKYFINDKEFKSLSKEFPFAISRMDIYKYSKQAVEDKTSHSIKLLFLASMIWGFGKVGYGPYRTAKMLNHKNSLTILENTFQLIISGKIKEAYDVFNLPFCGPVFFTKFFYFLGLGANLELNPLILDSRVAMTINDFSKELISKFAKVIKDDGNIVAIKRYSTGYINYLEHMDKWSKKLNCRPDQIEYFLFN